MNPAQQTSNQGRYTVVAFAFLGWLFAGFQLGLMPLASISVSKSFLGTAFTDAVGGDWFARYTASLMFGAAIGGMLFGWLGDRAGRARAMAASILVYSIFGAAGAAASSQGELLTMRFLVGLGIGGMWPNGVALVSEYWSDISRPLLAGLIGAAANVGIFLTSQMGTIHKVTPDSWRWLMLFGGLPTLLGLLSIYLVPESTVWLASRSHSTNSDSTASTSAPQNSGVQSLAAQNKGVSILDVFRSPFLRLTVIGILLGTIPLIGAWGSSKWMIPWADKMAGSAQPGYKALTQAWWAVGAALGSFLGGHIANLMGRRLTYFLISLGSVTITAGIFLAIKPLESAFLPCVFVQGFISTIFFGWLPLYLPELFPTRVRATGTGVTYNFGRFISAAGVLGAGSLMQLFGGDYAKVGTVTSMVYALGMIVIWFAPDTTGKSLAE